MEGLGDINVGTRGLENMYLVVRDAAAAGRRGSIEGGANFGADGLGLESAASGRRTVNESAGY